MCFFDGYKYTSYPSGCPQYMRGVCFLSGPVGQDEKGGCDQPSGSASGLGLILYLNGGTLCPMTDQSYM